jgi:serine/threonine protein kinase
MAVPVGDYLVNERYRLLREVGHGSTGHVYAAWDNHLEREVAIKILDHGFVDDRDVRGRFEREIHCTARLQHPGIVAVFESGQLPDGEICYVMTLARGETFDAYLAGLEQSDDHWKEASLVDRLTLFLKLLEVIAYAHSEEVVHRDLKPANVMLGDYGEVWVLDWGLARNLRSERDRPEEASPETAYEDLFGGYDKTRKRGTATVILPTAEIAADTGPQPGLSSLTRSQPEQETDQAAATRVGDATARSERRPRTGISDRLTPQDAEPGASSTALGRKGTGAEPEQPTRRSERESDHASSQVSRVRSAASRRLTTPNPRLERSTHVGEVLGSPAYMSPEQARGDAGAADKRADIYSLGVILVELLTFRTPCEMEPKEKLQHFIKRVQGGQRRTLTALWAEAPQVLHDICERALALDPQARYPDCAAFAHELRALLDQLSASYSELERQRLAKDREGAWHAAGHWDFAATPGLGPFSEAPRAYESEPVGQVMHPELGGLLVGGWGLQVYPMSAQVGNDLRLVIDAEVVRGSEFWVFLRGVPPSPCYQFRIGSYSGRWLAIGRSQGEGDLLGPELLTMRPLRRGSTTAIDQLRKVRLHAVKLVIEVVGSRLSLTLDDQPPLVVQDTCPLSGPLNRQLAIGTWESHAIIRSLDVQQRRSPLMVPSFAVANELLRQNLYPQAIDQYRTFLAEHGDSGEAIEAHFMLCLAFLRGGHTSQAERELRGFLSEYLEHPLSQDAIFELARLVMEQSGSIAKAVRVVLSYQESGDFVRSRFSLLLLPHLSERVRTKGLTANLIGDLETVRQLIRGSPDEELILVTMSQSMRWDAQAWADRLFDRDAVAEIGIHREALERLAQLGFQLGGLQRRTADEYRQLASRLNANDDLQEVRGLLHFGATDALEIGSLVRDTLELTDLGCGPLLLRTMGSLELRPMELILRAIVALRVGVPDAARSDLDQCFKLTDILETDRSDPHVLHAARMGCYGLGFLPWQLVWDSLAQGLGHHLFMPIAVVAGALAEALRHREDAMEAYRRAEQEGSGYADVARAGLRRLAEAGNAAG